MVWINHGDTENQSPSRRRVSSNGILANSGKFCICLIASLSECWWCGDGGDGGGGGGGGVVVVVMWW